MSPLQLTGDGAYKSTGKSSSYVLTSRATPFSLEESLQNGSVHSGIPTRWKILRDGQGGQRTPRSRRERNRPTSRRVRQSSAGKAGEHVSAIDFTMRDAAGKLTADELKHEYFYGKKNWMLNGI